MATIFMSTMEYHYQTMRRILSYIIQKSFSRVDMDIMKEWRGNEEEVL